MAKGFKTGGRQKGVRNKKTIWLLESLNERGFDFETKLVTLLEKAMKGDRIALEAAHLLVKLVPHVANAPKSDHTIAQIETLVINRIESPRKVEDIITEVVPTEVLDLPSQRVGSPTDQA